MKKLVTMLLVVVVAFLGGFPQVSGQSKICYELKTKFYVHDSSYWKVDTNQLKNILAGAQSILNMAGFNKNFKFVYAGWDTIPRTVTAYNTMKRKSYPGSIQLDLNTDFPKFEKDSTIVFPVFMGNVKMSLLNYPGAEVGWSVCRPDWPTWPQFGYNNIILLRSDSISRFDDSLYMRMFAHEALGRLGAGEYPLPGYLMSSRTNISTMTNIVDQATIVVINGKNYNCLKQLNDCGSVSTIEIEKTSLRIINNVVYNIDGLRVRIFDVSGRNIIFSKEIMINLSPHRGIFFLQVERKKPQKIIIF